MVAWKVSRCALFFPIKQWYYSILKNIFLIKKTCFLEKGNKWIKKFKSKLKHIFFTQEYKSLEFYKEKLQ